jgi:hypothetical protein
MSFSTSTGALTGTPTTVAAATAYIITATNASGSTTRTFTLSVTVSSVTCANGGACIVGDTGPGGGIVFYVAPETFTQVGATSSMCSTSCKYLEAAPTTGTNAWTDAEYAWSGNTSVEIGATAQGTAIGTGYANTLAIIGQSRGGNTAERAGTISRAYRGPNTLTDWFLPSKGELNQMCKWQAGITGVDLTTVTTLCSGGTKNTGLGAAGFVEDGYWSSTEDDSDHAWGQYFNYGDQDTSVKYYPFYVRPVRAF